MAEALVEHELCGNCKKEIPQSNYVMHTAHCARNITLCPTCKEPIPKSQFEEHKKEHVKVERPVAKGGVVPKQTNGYALPKPASSPLKPAPTPLKPAPTPLKPAPAKLPACKYCELELPPADMAEHEEYCGTRTDKCIECGEFVMFKYKKLHEDSNHGFVKLSDEPGPRASWDSTTQRTNITSTVDSLLARRTAFAPFRPFDMSTMYNMMDYVPPSLHEQHETAAKTRKEKEEYKKMSRRLDSKTEYIKNLLHDSASITAPLRTSGTQPRNHFNHNKDDGASGPAPQPPSRRRNPPTELTIPCEFCDTPIPHEDLIQHETGCRPDLARFNPRRNRNRPPSPDDDYFVAPQQQQPSSPEVHLPCEFCADMIPASQLLLHQAKCN